MANRKRVSFTLDPEVVSNLQYTSRRLGVSSSVLVSDLLAEPIADMRRLLMDVPESPKNADMLRFRGESIDIVNKRVAALQQLMDGDLFDDGK